MTDALKGAYKLRLTADGRAAENWPSYKVQVDNLLAGKDRDGIYLDDVINNEDSGVVRSDPGLVAAWIAIDPGCRTAALHAVEVPVLPQAWKAFKRANKTAHGLLMSTLPSEMQDEAAQHPLAHELWSHLETRFGGQTLTAVALTVTQLFNMTLDDHDNVSAFLTAMNRIVAEVTANANGGGEIPSYIVAGVILNAMGERYPMSRELMITLPLAGQTVDVYSTRLLEAEKNSHAVNEQQAHSAFRGHAASKTSAAKPKGSNKGASIPRCTYVRKLQWKSRWATPGSSCTNLPCFEMAARAVF